MGDVIDDIETRNILLLEEIDRLAFLFTEDSNQHIGAGHFLLAAGLDMEHGPLQHALEAQRGLGFAVHLLGSYQRRGRLYKFAQVEAQLSDICATGYQHLASRLVVNQCQQQVFNGHEFMTFGAGFLKGLA